MLGLVLVLCAVLFVVGILMWVVGTVMSAYYGRVARELEAEEKRRMMGMTTYPTR